MCPECGGLTYLRYPWLTLGDEGFGKLFPCYSCASKRPSPRTQGVPGKLAESTFANFDLSLNPTMKAAMVRCIDVAEGRAWCALLAGKVGTGKSHLGAAALNASVHPKPGMFWTWTDLVLWMRQQAFDERGPQRPEVEVVGYYQCTPALLVIDDVGAEKATEWTGQTLYAIVNARYEAQLPTILTTNFVASLDERIMSRMFEGAYAGTGQDVRRLGRK